MSSLSSTYITSDEAVLATPNSSNATIYWAASNYNSWDINYPNGTFLYVIHVSIKSCQFWRRSASRIERWYSGIEFIVDTENDEETGMDTGNPILCSLQTLAEGRYLGENPADVQNF